MGQRMLFLTQQFFFFGRASPLNQGSPRPKHGIYFYVCCSGCQTFAVGLRPATPQHGVCKASHAPDMAVRRLLPH